MRRLVSALVAWSLLLAPSAQVQAQNLPVLSGRDLSASSVKVPGGVARTLNDRAAEVTNVIDLGADRTGTASTVAAINAAIVKASGSGQFSEVRLPAGRYLINKGAPSDNTIIPRSNVVLRGAGMGRTILVCDDRALKQACLNNSTATNVFAPINDFHLRDLTFQGMGETEREQGAQIISVGNCTNCSVEGVESRYSRQTGLLFLYSNGLRARGNRIYRPNGDGIAVWGTSDAIITDNEIIGVNDDSISAHVSNIDSDPAIPNANGTVTRTGLVIANNSLTEGQGIRVIGAKVTSITGNVMRRMMAHGISVEAVQGTQGNTAPFAVAIRGNIISDVFRRPEDPPRNQDQVYIAISGGPRTPGSGSSPPGVPVVGTGTVTPLYGGDGIGSFYRNGNDVPTAVATPGGYWFDVSDNILVRSLPAVTAWPNWGFGPSLFVGRDGASAAFTGAVPEANLQTTGIKIGPTLRNSRISRNTISTSGMFAIQFSQNPATDAALNYDGLTIENNKISNFSNAGISLPLNTAQRIIVRNNEFDGDPRFANPNRGANGTWQSASGAANMPIALSVGSTTGVTHYGNVYRNVSEPVNGVANPSLGRNIVYADPVGLGFSASNRGVGVIPDPNLFTLVVEDSDPASATFGAVKSQTAISASAQPSSGFYLAGHYVQNNTPTTGGRVLLGWSRLTTGSAHVAGTDWQAVYARPISTEITDSTPVGRSVLTAADAAAGASAVGLGTTSTPTFAGLKIGGGGQYVAGALFSDVSFGFLYRPLTAGNTAAHALMNTEGTICLMCIRNDGKVGIGTGAGIPGARLDVVGTMRGQMLSLTGAPLAADIPASYWTVVKRTDDASVKICANDAGTIKCAALQ